MIVEYVRYDLKTHEPLELIKSYIRAAEHLKAAPECLGFDLSQCEEEPRSFVLRILWRSTKDHLEGFRKGPHFPPFLAEIGDYIKEVAEMRHYQPTDVTWVRGRQSYSTAQAPQ